MNNRDIGRIEAVRNVVRTGLKTNMTLLTVVLSVHVAPSSDLRRELCSVHV